MSGPNGTQHWLWSNICFSLCSQSMILLHFTSHQLARRNSRETRWKCQTLHPSNGPFCKDFHTFWRHLSKEPGFLVARSIPCSFLQCPFFDISRSAYQGPICSASITMLHTCAVKNNSLNWMAMRVFLVMLQENWKYAVHCCVVSLPNNSLVWIRVFYGAHYLIPSIISTLEKWIREGNSIEAFSQSARSCKWRSNSQTRATGISLRQTRWFTDHA